MEPLISSFAPDGVSLFAACALVVISFLTAFLTAALGLGGGLALLAAMSALLPPAAVIPVHGAAQFGANLSRFWFLRAHAVWWMVWWFTAGGLIGAAAGGRVTLLLPTEALRIFVALFILISVWGPKLSTPKPGRRAFFAIGAIAAFLTMFFGATGPIAATLIGATNMDRLKTVGTHAAAMVAQHALKSLIFGAMGFAFHEWALLIMGIIAAGSAGSYAGAATLKAMPDVHFRRGFNAILTLIALYLMIAGLSGLFT